MPPRATKSSEPRRGESRGRWSHLWEQLQWNRIFWSTLFLVGLTCVFLLRHTTQGGSVRTYDAGEIVIADLKAPFDFEFRDEERTAAERRLARESVPPVYDFNSRVALERVEDLHAAFERLRSASRELFSRIQGPPPTPSEPGGAGAASSGSDAAGADGAADPLPPTPYPLPPPSDIQEALEEAFPDAGEGGRRALWRHGFPASLEGWLAESLESLQRSKIAASVEGLREGGKIVVRDVHTGAEWEDPQPSRVLSLEEGRAQMVGRADEIPVAAMEPEERRAVAEWASALIRPTLSPNVRETETRRRRVAEKVAPVVEVVPKGKILVREGEEVTPYQAAQLRSLAQRSASTRDWRSVLGYAGLALALLAFLWVFLRGAAVERGAEGKPLLAMTSLTTVCTVALGAVLLWVADALTEALMGPWEIHADTLRFALPWAAGSMVLAILVNRSVAVAFTIPYSVLMGVYLGGDYPVTLFCLLSGLAGAFAAHGFKKRSDAVRASLRIGTINVGIVLILHAFSPWLSGIEWSVWDYAAAFAGGASVLITFHLLFPLLEHAFGVLTDVRLLELGDPDNKLLRELAMRAPGTYQHSMAVGRLAEAAAEAIGANALFCRVAALYHDIGKLRKPEYFIENQRDGVNLHERLSPHMSTLIIVSHVKDGLVMTRKEKLPRPIRDIIPEHHGTRLITYFYKKAGEPEDDSDFRYPGPKPQTKEAAIFMLADGAEAAARTLQNPTSARLKGMIRQVTNAVMLDGQLDQCDLSFKEISSIQDAFLKILLSTYHGRIDYPGFDFEGKRERRRRTGSKAGAKSSPKGDTPHEKIVRFPPGSDR